MNTKKVGRHSSTKFYGNRVKIVLRIVWWQRNVETIFSTS